MTGPPRTSIGVSTRTAGWHGFRWPSRSAWSPQRPSNGSDAVVSRTEDRSRRRPDRWWPWGRWAPAWAGAVAALAIGEERLASTLGGALAARLPGSPLTWRLTGHAVVLSVVGGVTSTLWGQAMQRIEKATLTDDPVLDGRDDSSLVMTRQCVATQQSRPLGGHGSRGRRHVLTAVRPRPWTDETAGLPDLSIPTVTGEPAVADPVNMRGPRQRTVPEGSGRASPGGDGPDISVGPLAHHAHIADRDRLRQLLRGGRGQYLTRGDVATVTLQYSKRPSPLSLGMIDDAREQNRLLWSMIAERLRDLPSERRPKVVLFGESLGAHTSQDVFLHWERWAPGSMALWVGTPTRAAGCTEVVRGGRPTRTTISSPS